MRKLLIALASLLLVAALASCGSSDSSDEGASEEKTTTTSATPTTTEADDDATATTAEAVDVSGLTRDDYVQALVANLSTGSEDDGQLVIEPDQAECIAPKWVDAITVELLQENEVTVEQLSDPGFSGSDLGMDLSQGEAMVDAFSDCGVDIVALFAQAFGQGLEADQQACIAENVDPELVRALLAATFSSGSSDAEFEAVLNQLDPVCDLPDA